MTAKTEITGENDADFSANAELSAEFREVRQPNLSALASM
jgi:hypothetical protein